MTEPKSMREIHLIQERIFKKERRLTSKQRLAEIKRVSDEVRNKYKINFRTHNPLKKAA